MAVIKVRDDRIESMDTSGFRRVYFIQVTLSETKQVLWYVQARLPVQIFI